MDFFHRIIVIVASTAFQHTWYNYLGDSLNLFLELNLFRDSDNQIGLKRDTYLVTIL